MHFTVRTPKVFLPSVWPLPRSLATTGGISVDFSSSPYLDVSVQAVPLICLCIQHMMTRLSSCRIAPFGHPRIYRSLTAPRGFSQLVTSFFGSRCQGIPLVLFVAWPFLMRYLWFFVISLKIGCFTTIFFHPYRNCSIFTFVIWVCLTKPYLINILFSLYLLSLFSFQGTLDKMSTLVTLRCSVNNSHSSNLFRCLWQLHSLVLASRYFRAPRLGFSYLVGLSGLEPPTSRLSGVRSNRLSYKPILVWLKS